MNELRALDITVDIWDRIKFYPQFWFRRAFMCPFNQHKWWVLYITDGRTSVWCTWCKAKREATAEEARKHPNVGRTPEQLARQQEQIEKAEQRLRDMGY